MDMDGSGSIEDLQNLNQLPGQAHRKKPLRVVAMHVDGKRICGLISRSLSYDESLKEAMAMFEISRTPDTVSWRYCLPEEREKGARLRLMSTSAWEDVMEDGDVDEVVLCGAVAPVQVFWYPTKD